MYRSCHEARLNFFNWFQNIQIDDDANWLVLGDYNYVGYPHNINRERDSIQDMFLFNEAISQHDLVEIPLKRRSYTWSNMQDAPLLEKLDWCFTSEAQTLTYPSTFDVPLARTISDHVPVVIKIGTSIQKPHTFRFKNYCYIISNLNMW